MDNSEDKVDPSVELNNVYCQWNDKEKVYLVFKYNKLYDYTLKIRC